MTAVVAETPPLPDGTTAADQSAKESEGPERRRPWATGVCLLAYAALAVVAFLPAGPLDSNAVPAAVSGNPAGSDPFQMMWFLSWLPFALTHGLNIFHTTQFDYPQGVNLADNTSVPLLSLIGWPVTATLGPVATFNILLRLAFALSAGSMFLVLRRWCSSTIAPFVGGLLYGFGPYMTGQELHLDLIFVPIPPLLLWCADELVRTRRMRRWRLGVLMGVAAAAQMLISPDVLSGCLFIAICAGIVLAAVHRHLLRERLAYIAGTVSVATVVFLVLCGYLIFEMVAGPDHLIGAVIPPSALQGLHADLVGTLVPTRNQLLIPHSVARFGDGFVASNLSENGSYLGLPLVLVLVVIAWRLRRDPLVRVVTWLAVGSLILSLGPTLSIFNKNTHIPLPETVFAHLPLLDNTIPARYALYVSLFVAVLLAIGVDRLWLGPAAHRPPAALWRRLGRVGRDTPAARRARVGVVAAIAVLSLLPNLPFSSRAVPWPAALTRSIRTLVPAGSVILAYPYPTPLRPEAMLWEAQAGMDYHLLGGYANVQFGHFGHRWPELLSPPYVQEVLGYTATGDHWPSPGPVGTAGISDLYVFLARYSVGAVVFWAGPDNHAAAYTYLVRALGLPTERAPKVAVWLPVNGHWPSSRRRP
ncbi:MAG: hypothetical protein ABSE47_12270 [Acidimicrobiales bacterium]|jgi:hypothetical protein